MKTYSSKKIVSINLSVTLDKKTFFFSDKWWIKIKLTNGFKQEREEIGLPKNLDS